LKSWHFVHEPSHSPRGSSAGSHTPRLRLVCSQLRPWPWLRLDARFYQAEPAPVVGTTKYPESLCPRSALPPLGRPIPRLLRGHCSPFFAHTDSCANPVGSPLLRFSTSFEESGQVATSPCCQRHLPDSIFANLSSDAWSPAPTVPPSAFACFFLESSAFPKTLWVGFPFSSANAILPRANFRGCRHFVMFRPLSLLASQIAPTAANLPAGQPRLLRPGISCFVASARSGYAIRPHRQLTEKGLSPFKICNLVGCSSASLARATPLGWL